MSTVKKNRRLEGLNLLRTVALLGVFLYHAYPNVVRGGYLGVITFFVISGYLTAYNTNNQRYDQSFSLLNYYKKRIVRLYPAMIIVLLISSALLAIIDKFKMINSQQEILSILLGYNNFWQITMNASYFTNLTNTSPFTHFWYLSILLQFTLIWPFILFIYALLKRTIGRSKTLLVFFLVVLVSMLVLPVRVLLLNQDNFTSLYYATSNRIFALLCGALFGLMKSERVHLKLLSFNKVGTLLFVLLWLVVSVVLYIYAEGTALWVYVVGMQAYTLLTCFTIDVLNQRLRMRLSNPLLTFISDISYPFYLWQYPILFLCGISSLPKTWYIFVLEVILIVIMSIWTNKITRMLGSK